MKRSFQPGMAAVILTAAMLQAFVPASADSIVYYAGIVNFPPVDGSGHAVEAHYTTVNVLPGGSIGDDLWALDYSTVNVSGGTIVGLLAARDNSTMTIFGTGFNFADGDYSDGSSLDSETLTGFLADGTAINNTVNIFDSGKVTLAATA